MFVGRFNCMAIAIMLNIVTARVTEADNPAINAKLHKRKISSNVFKNRPCLMSIIGFNKKFNIIKIIPTCKPETANICMAPASI